MKFYTQTHTHYCGIDLHARNLYICILDQAGNTLVHKNINKASPDALMKLIAPYREDLVIGVECMFSWYWVADLCREKNIAFILGHALYMRAIHGGKAKNDKIDSHKIAALMRGGMFPEAYVYPREMRGTRDLMRRRMHLMRKRSELLAHVHNTNSQYNLPEISAEIGAGWSGSERRRLSTVSVEQMVRNTTWHVHTVLSHLSQAPAFSQCEKYRFLPSPVHRVS